MELRHTAECCLPKARVPGGQHCLEPSSVSLHNYQLGAVAGPPLCPQCFTGTGPSGSRGSSISHVASPRAMVSRVHCFVPSPTTTGDSSSLFPGAARLGKNDFSF